MNTTCAICDKPMECADEYISRCCCWGDDLCNECVETASLKEYIRKCVK